MAEVIQIKGRLYQSSLGVLQGFLKKEKLATTEEVDKLDWVGAVEMTNKWLDAALATTEGGGTEILLLNDALPHFVEVKEEATTNVIKVKKEDQSEEKPADKGEVVGNRTGLIRRDFKVVGQLTHDKGSSLTFVSLIRQLESGSRKGYKDFELVEGVIKAIDPSMPLRGYLEGRTDLTLGKLRHILRSHFQEKTSSALYHELGVAAQGVRNPQDFLIYLLDLKQKVLFTSKEQSDEVAFTEKQVSTLFKRTLDTGLVDETVRRELKPVLEREGLDDEELLKAMCEITSKETERKTKLCSSKPKQAKVNSVSEDSINEQPDNGKKNSKAPKEGVVMSAIKELQAEVAALKSTVEQRNTDHSGKENLRRFKRKCGICTQDNSERCTHCWKCGSSDHFSRGCRVRPSENAKGSSHWGQE